MNYRLIPLRGNNIVSPRISNKPRLHAKFGSNIMKYLFYVINFKIGGKGQVNTHTDDNTER